MLSDMEIHVFTVLACGIIAMLVVDLFMTYLQSNHGSWRIPHTTPQGIVHLLLLFSASGLGYWVCFNIGALLPESRPTEPVTNRLNSWSHPSGLIRYAKPEN